MKNLKRLIYLPIWIVLFLCSVIVGDHLLDFYINVVQFFLSGLDEFTFIGFAMMGISGLTIVISALLFGKAVMYLITVSRLPKHDIEISELRKQIASFTNKEIK